MVVPSITARISVIKRMLPDWLESLNKRIFILFLLLQVAEHHLSCDDTLRVDPPDIGSGTAPGHIDQFRSGSISGGNKISIRVRRPQIASEAPLAAAGEKGARGLAGLGPGEQTGG